MKLPVIKSEKDITDLIEELGFLPFFRNGIEGFSIAEACAPERWFSDTLEGPWEWKGPIIKKTGCAYGKFLSGKAMYISKRFFPDFANYRRDGYDYDARIDDGKARNRDLKIMEVLSSSPSMLSKELKASSCFGEESAKQFDSSMAFLQMQCYAVISDFEYMTAKDGKRYGWGIARYSTPESLFGEDFTSRVYNREPEESGEMIREHLRKTVPGISEKQIDRFLGKKG